MKTLQEIRDDAVVERLMHFKGHRQRAADSLGISIRTITNVLARIRHEDPETFKKIPHYEMTDSEKLIGINKRVKSSSWVAWLNKNKMDRDKEK